MTIDDEVKKCIENSASLSAPMGRSGQYRYCRLLRPHSHGSPERYCQFAGSKAAVDIGTGRHINLAMVYICRFYESEVMR